MLTAYETAVYALLQAPSSPNALIPIAAVDTAINTARSQLAADAECIRVPATLTLTSGVQVYNFSSIFISPPTAGATSVIAVRLARTLMQRLDIRSFEWFSNYYLNNTATGQPLRMAQQGQGANGTLYFHPIPNATFAVSLDVVALPVDLTSNATPEAIPYPWTDAVPFYAAWLLLMQLQRQADADKMLMRYKELARRGRQESTPTVLPGNLPGDAGAKAAAAKTQLTLPQETR